MRSRCGAAARSRFFGSTISGSLPGRNGVLLVHRLEHRVADVQVQVVVGLAVFRAVGADPDAGNHAPCDVGVLLDLLAAVEPGVADAVDVGGRAPAVARGVPAERMRRRAITAVGGHVHIGADFLAEQFERAGQQHDRARNVAREGPHQRRFAHVDPDQFPQLEVGAQRRLQRLAPRIHPKERRWQSAGDAAAVLQCFARAQHLPRLVGQFVRVDEGQRQHAQLRFPVMYSYTAREIRAIVSWRAFTSGAHSVRITTTYASRPSR